MAPRDDSGNEDTDHAARISEAASKPATTEPSPRAVHWRRYVGVGLIAMLGPLIAIAAGLYIYLAGGRYVVTDNAYVKADKIVVSTDVSGRVAEVLVTENQTVQRDEVLFRIDQEPFRIALERAEARVLAARQNVMALRAIYKQKQAGLTRSRSEVEHHRRLFEIQKKLARRNLVSGINFETASRNLRDAEDQVKITEQELAQARARLGGSPDVDTDAHPDVKEAVALRDQAALELKLTEVKAPVRGVVTNFELQRGEYVRMGNPIFSMVGIDNTWVHANYKETELTHVRVGQKATISVDTYPNHTFKAVVAGISPATGAEFALLPPQNATGNWVKVVQRLTVRLKLEPIGNGGTAAADGQTAAAEPILRAGMSAHVEIDTEHRRRLPGVFSLVGDWPGGHSRGNL